MHLWPTSIVNLLLTCSYIQYSALCARLVRRALKPDFKAEALKVEETGVRITQWEGGKAVPSEYMLCEICSLSAV